MTFLLKSDKWQIISQLIDSCPVAPKFGTEQLNNQYQQHTIFQQ
jgi:hypothetical protein